MAPYDAFELVTALKSEVDLPIQLHLHYTSGMASMTALKAVEAGVDVLDVCLAPLALRTSQPAVEPIVVALGGTERDPGIDRSALLNLGDKLESVLTRYRGQLESTRSAVIDARVLSHQIPGGMASNMVSQLREADALDKLDEVLANMPSTRADLGYPPLVTPMSQMVGAQAVSNVLFGRYAVISDPVKEYVRGNYGKPVSQISDEIVDKVIEGDGGKSAPPPERPGAVLDPELDVARTAVADMTDDIDDVLTYALYPQTGLSFLRVKHGLDQAPDETKTPDVAQVETVSPPTDASPRSSRARRFNVYVGDSFFEVEVDPIGSPPPAPPPARSATPSAAPTPPAQTAAQPAAVAEGETAVRSPMPGILLSLAVEEGQRIEAGEPLLVLEAMKMQNTIPSPVSGTVKSLPVAPGTQVLRDQVLATIES